VAKCAPKVPRKSVCRGNVGFPDRSVTGIKDTDEAGFNIANALSQHKYSALEKIVLSYFNTYFDRHDLCASANNDDFSKGRCMPTVARGDNQHRITPAASSPTRPQWNFRHSKIPRAGTHTRSHPGFRRLLSVWAGATEGYRLRPSHRVRVVA
jgi:hypothetical protein